MILFYFQDVSVVAFSNFQASKQLNIKVNPLLHAERHPGQEQGRRYRKSEDRG